MRRLKRARFCIHLAFQSTHPLRGATFLLPPFGICAGISIHAPLAGCDPRCSARQPTPGDFNPRTPCGVRHGPRLTDDADCDISIHAPLAGCDDTDKAPVAVTIISIHAPLAGCDIQVGLLRLSAQDFNPRTPCGVRLGCDDVVNLHHLFQSTHPLRGATWLWPDGNAPEQHFNPRTPCGVRRFDTINKLGRETISIHAPLAGCDPGVLPGNPPQGISIHAPLAGCDIWPFTSDTTERYFNPRTPCGVRRAFIKNHALIDKFQSTHPLRGATWCPPTARQRSNISIHAPLAGCDGRKVGYTSGRIRFQSTHPLRGATDRQK